MNPAAFHELPALYELDDDDDIDTLVQPTIIHLLEPSVEEPDESANDPDAIIP